MYVSTESNEIVKASNLLALAKSRKNYFYHLDILSYMGISKNILRFETSRYENNVYIYLRLCPLKMSLFITRVDQ